MFERLIFLVSIAMIAFFGGMAASHFRAFPYPQVRDAARTAKALLSGDESTVAPMNRIGAAETSPDVRWERTGETDGSILVFGGYGQFMEFCPETGCLAVRFDASGEAVESWPFRLEEILQADRVGEDYPREFVQFDPPEQMYPIGIDRYADGDLLVTFQVRGNFFPFAGGVARVAPDGRPRWYRNDFSHHWPMILPDGTALVPTLRVGSGSVHVDPAGATPSSDMVLRCPSGRPQIDTLTVLAPDGTVKREIDLLAMVQASPWRTVLGATSNACDPLHLNFVDVTGREDTEGLPSRLVLSFRNISAFGIIDLETGTLEYLHRGSFAQQHAVHHLDGSQFILFDNLGADTAGPASRVVTVDIATGEERRVFPLIDDANPPPFTKNAGHIDLSRDRKRLLVSVSHAGRGFEVDLETGQVVTEYRNVHAPQTGGGDNAPEAALYSLYGMSYVED